jgi:hypothetical protein
VQRGEALNNQCKQCDGEGKYDVLKGSYFCRIADQYEPNYRVEECDACGGTGFVERWDDEDGIDTCGECWASSLDDTLWGDAGAAVLNFGANPLPAYSAGQFG